jgi:hypothetical protein
VFDVDEHPRLAEAIALAGRHSIGLAISNPCLELWFLLHFEDRTAYIDRHDVQRRAQKHLGCDKVLTDPALHMLADRYPDAVARATRLDDKHRGDGSVIGANPSTTVWRLIEEIRGPAAGR